VTGTQKVEFLKAVQESTLGLPVTGIVRTALREWEGLPPVPGDEV
jgi:hypothetical protein